jgi:hypothetical protein
MFRVTGNRIPAASGGWVQQQVTGPALSLNSLDRQQQGTDTVGYQRTSLNRPEWPDTGMGLILVPFRHVDLDRVELAILPVLVEDAHPPAPLYSPHSTYHQHGFALPMPTSVTRMT